MSWVWLRNKDNNLVTVTSFTLPGFPTQFMMNQSYYDYLPSGHYNLTLVPSYCNTKVSDAQWQILMKNSYASFDFTK